MDWGSVQTAWDEALESACARGGLESVVDALEAWCLLVYFVNSVLSEW